LDIAIANKVHIDTVLAYRKRYLERIKKEETNKKFAKAFSEHPDLDWTKIKEKIKADKAKESKMK